VFNWVSSTAMEEKHASTDPGLDAKTIYCVVYGLLLADHGFSAPSPRESHEAGKDRLGSWFMATSSVPLTATFWF
jgi:hypothetical protein